MLKNIFFILFLSIVVSIKANAQPTFYSTYSLASGATEYIESSVFTKVKDNSFIGISSDSSAQLFSVYKIDINGNLQWRKQFLLPEISFGVKAITLADSSVAFLFTTNKTIYDMIVLKVSEQGTILWCNGYGLTVSSYSAFEPTTDGGIAISGAGCAGGDLHIRLDSNGSILFQKGHNGVNRQMSLNVIDMIHEGNDSYFKLAYDSSYPFGAWPFLFYQVDQNGESSNMQVVTLNGESMSSIGTPQSKLIAKASNKGYYALYGLQPDSGYAEEAVLFYFNDNKNLRWARKISAPGIELTPKFINTDSDFGCLVSFENHLNSDLFNRKRLPLYIQFDTSGTMQWYNTPGDTIDPNWSEIELTSLMRSVNDGIVSIFTRNFTLEFSTADKYLNGFCNYTTVTPVITPLSYTITTDTVYSFPFHNNETPIALTPINIASLRTDQCNSVTVEENSNANPLVYPNPATTELNISSDISLVEIYSLTGVKVLSLSNPASRIDVSNLEDGVYIVKIEKRGGGISFQKVMVF